MSDDTLYVEYIGGDDVKMEKFEFTIEGEPELLVWNVTKARALVLAGGFFDTKTISREAMQDIADRCQWDPAHLVKADPTKPGIASPLIVPSHLLDHEEIQGRTIIYQLIDGIHRCVRALQLGLPYQAHLLTDEAARACYKGPPKYLP